MARSVGDEPSFSPKGLNCPVRGRIAPRRRETWATLTFAIELRESLSGRSLVRYSKSERIMSPGTGEDRAELVLANYAAIVEGIDLPGMVTGGDRDAVARARDLRGLDRAR